jgi:long-chain acyl-CoA synthetase
MTGEQGMLASSVGTVAELFRARVEQSSGFEAWRVRNGSGWRTTSWAELGAAVDRAAAGLAGLGIGPGDAVAILGDTCPTWCVADLAAIVLGGNSVGLYPTLTDEHLKYIVADSGARVLFVQGSEHLERVRPLLTDPETDLKRIVVWDHDPGEGRQAAVLSWEAMEEGGGELPSAGPGPEDVALVVYTSGTTGEPKGVPLTHDNVIKQLASGGDLIPDPITPEDITLAFLPMSHVAEHVPGFFGRINLGLRAAFCESYDTVLDDLLDVRPTYFGAVPRIFEKMYGRIRERVGAANPRRQAIFRWAEARARRRSRALTGVEGPLTLPERLASSLADRLVFRRMREVFGGRVKTFLTGAAPINLEILEFFHGAGFTILEVYGLSETTAIAFANAPQPGMLRLGTVGKALPGVQCRLADDGEVLLKGPSIFAGYLNRPDTDREAFDDDGWFRTGDIGALDKDGFLTLTDRKKNLIKTAGGKYVAPARLEALIKEEPIVSQVYVHGDERPYVVALVTLDEREAPRVAEELGCTEADLPTHPEVVRRIDRAVAGANRRLARFEQIKRHAVLPEDFSIEHATLTPTLKIKRREVASRYSSHIDRLYAAGESP